MEAGDGSPTSELLAPQPPPLPERINRGGKRARDGPLLFGTQLIKHEGKDDELVVEAAPQGAEAIVPSESPEKQPPAAVQVDKAKLYCSLGACSLTPPIYQCAVGHLACCSCRVKFPGRRCRTCRDRGTASSAYAHCPGLDLFFGDLRVPCDFEEYGCRAYVPYFLGAKYRGTCEHAPCHCPEPGCSLLCSPRTLAAHLAVDHYWTVYEVAYGTPLPLAISVPAVAASGSPAPARDLRLLRGDDASLLLMAVGPLSDGAAVSVVLVRATASPPALPRYTCTFYANPPLGAADLEGGYFFATVPVRSSALADGAGVAPEKELYFAVPWEMLCGGSRELLGCSSPSASIARRDLNLLSKTRRRSLRADQSGWSNEDACRVCVALAILVPVYLAIALRQTLERIHDMIPKLVAEAVMAGGSSLPPPPVTHWRFGVVAR